MTEYCPYCDKHQIPCSDPPACIMGEKACNTETALWRAQSEISRLEKRLAEAEQREALVAELVEAVKKLPVEDWVERDFNGDPELLGYVMQCQGEWDEVRRKIEALTALQQTESGERSEPSAEGE